MKKFYAKRIFGIAALAAMLLTCANSADAIGWPANYKGVMLQGFAWDTYKTNNEGKLPTSKWTDLTSRADELSANFSLIWVPNSARASGESGGGNGYMPIYWFTNHTCAYGNEAALKTMIATFKEKGTGIIEDVVINHRAGVSNWTNFPSETWNGQTWKIGPEGICRTDEVARASGQATPTGAADTGDDFDGARDLDHTNANVQNNCKNYCKFLLDDMGYAGFRLDMVKGYGGQYTKIYNEYSKPTFCVGEYWDGYDAITAWIDKTGKTSAAFDFPGKYAINEAFSSNDMTKLVWKAYGTTDQPAGLIHANYRQYAVTFVDNHDTYRNDNKFNGNVVAANAFIILSPGTPCVFWAHYNQYKAEISKLIEIRNANGIHNLSEVKVLQSTSNCYMAEVTGTEGKVVVKIGSAQVSPSGYSNSDIKASGNDYCVWAKKGGSPVVDPDVPVVGDVPENLYVLGNIDGASWNTNSGVKMTKSGNTFTATKVKFTPDAGETNVYFTFVTALGVDWDAVNSYDRYGAPANNTPISVGVPASITKYAVGVDASSAKSWEAAPGTYNIIADFDSMTVTITGENDVPVINPTLPDLYIIGEVNGNTWAPNVGVKMDKEGSNLVKTVTLGADKYFSFAKSLASGATDWNTMNAAGNRFAPEVDTELTPDTPASFTQVSDGNNAKAFYTSTGGEYKIIVDWTNKTVKITSASGVPGIEADNEAVYFNLQGVRVTNPGKGIFIRVAGGKTSKVIR